MVVKLCRPLTPRSSLHLINFTNLQLTNCVCPSPQPIAPPPRNGGRDSSADFQNLFSLFYELRFEDENDTKTLLEMLSGFDVAE